MRPGTITLLAAAALAGAGCSKAGMGANVRADVTARMESAKDPIEACYAGALEKNRKLAGTIVVSFRAAPSSGAFEGIEVVRDDVGDPAVTECVLAEIAKLKLATPQKTALAITYPIDFAPTK